MSRNRVLRFILALAIFSPFAKAVCAQNASAPDKTLVINGKNVSAGVRQIDGHSYVDIDALARTTNGHVTVETNRIVLTIPLTQAAPSAAPVTVAAPVQNPLALSREFARSAISEIAEMREWRGAIGTMVTYGLAVSGTWTQDYHDRVDAGLRQAAVTASTDADRSALQLLTAEFDTLSGWANDLVAARQQLNAAKTLDPNSLQNDPVLAKITSCSRFLNGMLISGSFSDDGSCR